MNEWHKQNEFKPWQEHKFFKAQAFLFNVKILDILVQEKKCGSIVFLVWLKDKAKTKRLKTTYKFKGENTYSYTYDIF